MSTAAPAPASTAPATRTGAGYGLPVRQPVSHQGTSPVTTPGAITRNTAVPAAAVILRIGPTRQALQIRPRCRRLASARLPPPANACPS